MIVRKNGFVCIPETAPWAMSGITTHPLSSDYVCAVIPDKSGAVSGIRVQLFNDMLKR